MKADAPRQNYWNIDRIMQLIIGLAITAVLVLLMRYLSDVLLPFFVACFVAYLLQPIVDFNSRLLKGRGGRPLASVMTVIDFTAIISVIVYLFLPSVLNELDTLGAILGDLTSGRKEIPEAYKGIVDFIGTYFDPDNLKTMLSGEHLATILSKGSSLLQESLDILLQILSWLLTLIYILFILIDYPQICRGFKLIIPADYRDRMMSVVADVERCMNHYFRGQGLVALCAVVLYCTGFSIVGLPLAVPMGILVGILYMIPYFQYVTLIPVSAVCLIYSLGGQGEFMSMFGKCLLVYVISQCICDYIVTPHVMGREMGLNPAVILLSLSVWGSLLGIIGMIIALPATALIMTYYERYISNNTRSKDS